MFEWVGVDTAHGLGVIGDNLITIGNAMAPIRSPQSIILFPQARWTVPAGFAFAAQHAILTNTNFAPESS